MTQENVTRGTGVLESFLARQRAKMADRLISSPYRDGCVVDLGCGAYPLFLAQTRFARKIGLDRFEGMGSPCRLLEHGIEFVRHDLTAGQQLPLNSGFCDVVTMLAVVEHIEPERVVPLFREVHRVLKPGGALILTTPAAWVDRLLRIMATARLVSPVEIGEHKAAYTQERLRALLGQVFRTNEVKLGFFEMFMNIWACARK
jgi:SAM-dependent methyltransferase